MATKKKPEQTTPAATTDAKKEEPIVKDWGYYEGKAKENLADQKPADFDASNIAKPDASRYQHDQGWWDYYFPTVSQKDEQERTDYVVKNAQWQSWGNALAAIANAVGGTQGVKPVALTEPKIANLDAWKKSIQEGRQARAQEQARQDKAYTDAMTKYEGNVAKALQEYQKRLASYNSNVTRVATHLRDQDVQKQKEEESRKFQAEQAEKGRKATRSNLVYSNNQADARAAANRKAAAERAKQTTTTSSTSVEGFDGNGNRTTHRTTQTTHGGGRRSAKSKKRHNL